MIYHLVQVQVLALQTAVDVHKAGATQQAMLAGQQGTDDTGAGCACYRELLIWAARDH
jgi:hypothetical protein